MTPKELAEEFRKKAEAAKADAVRWKWSAAGYAAEGHVEAYSKAARMVEENLL